MLLVIHFFSNWDSNNTVFYDHDLVVWHNSSRVMVLGTTFLSGSVGNGPEF